MSEGWSAAAAASSAGFTSVDMGTIVIDSGRTDPYDTVQVRNDDTYVPPYAHLIKKNQQQAAPSPRDTAANVSGRGREGGFEVVQADTLLQYSNFTVPELERLKKSLDAQMKKELDEVTAKYDSRKAPIEEAIRLKSK